MATLLERLRRAYEMGADHGSLQLIGPMLDVSIGLDLTDVQGLISSATAKADADGFRKQRDEARVDLARETGQHVATRADLDLARKGVVEEQTRADGLLKDVCALEIERDDLRAQVAQMTSGVPFRWALAHANGTFHATYATEGQARRLASGFGQAFPLFRATQPSPQVAELAAKLEAMGIELAREKRMREETRLDLVKAQDERDSSRADHLASSRIHLEQVNALQARIDTLTAGERLTKDALAAAEKRARTFETEAAHARGERDSLSSQLQAANIAASDKAKKLEMELAQVAEGHDFWKRAAEKAETRVVELETTTEPHSWAFDSEGGGTAHRTNRADAEADAARWGVGPAFPLYRHPPKTGEPVAWGVRTAKGLWTFPTKQEAEARFTFPTVTPLYEAPPPAAIGVAGSLFVATWKSDCRPGCRVAHSTVFDFIKDAEARLPGSKSYESAVMRLVPIDAPTVNIPAIRTVIADLREAFPTQTGEQSARLLLAAIGEKA